MNQKAKPQSIDMPASKPLVKAEKCVIDHTLGMSLAVRVPGRSAWPSFVASRRCSSDTGGTWSGPASGTRAQATQA